MTARNNFRKTGLAIALSCASLMVACATQPHPQPDVPGFAAGLLHGFLAILALAGSLYFNIRIYAFPNGGFGYDAGYVLGFSLNIVVITLLVIPKIGGYFAWRH